MGWSLGGNGVTVWFLGGQAPHPLLKSSINKMCLHLRGALTRGKSEAGVYWARGYITVSEPAKGAGASQGFWEKVGLKPGRQKDRPPGGRDHMVKCKEEGAGGQGRVFSPKCTTESPEELLENEACAADPLKHNLQGWLLAVILIYGQE